MAAERQLQTLQASLSADPTQVLMRQVLAMGQQVGVSPHRDDMKDVRELALNPEQTGSLEQWQLFERDVKTFVDDTTDRAITRLRKTFEQQAALVAPDAADIAAHDADVAYTKTVPKDNSGLQNRALNDVQAHHHHSSHRRSRWCH